jgi:hypothetical protein
MPFLAHNVRSKRVFTPGAIIGVAALVSGLLVGQMGSALAQTGSSAANAVAIADTGQFGGTVMPQKEMWFKVAYLGGDPITINTSFLPVDSPLTDLVIYTGGADSPRQEDITATRSEGMLSQTFSDPNGRDVFIVFVNEHQDRTVSFSGEVTPTTLIQGPPLGTAVPAPGPVAATPDVALNMGTDGTFTGVVAPKQVVWYRFYYGGPNTNATVSATFAPATNSAMLHVYTGPDVAHLTQQTAAPTRTGAMQTRTVNLQTAQWVYVTIDNSNGANHVAYVGTESPVWVAPVPQPTATPVPAPAPAPVVPVPPVVQPAPQAPAVVHDTRYFAETRYRIDDNTIWDFFNSNGGIETFGYPVSRTFTFLGCGVQVFQRQIIQVCGTGGAALMNIMDPEIFGYTRVNGSVFPAADDALKNSTPQVSDPNYSTLITQFVQANAPDTFNGRQTNFAQTFFATGGLQIWGAPISRPQADPGNADFVYQRFQRGIMHYIGTQNATRGILLADYLKAIITNQNLPGDLAAQAGESRFYNQYCPGSPGWLCRANVLEGTDLTYAFEQG